MHRQNSPPEEQTAKSSALGPIYNAQGAKQRNFESLSLVKTYTYKWSAYKWKKPSIVLYPCHNWLVRLRTSADWALVKTTVRKLLKWSRQHICVQSVYSIPEACRREKAERATSVIAMQLYLPRVRTYPSAPCTYSHFSKRTELPVRTHTEIFYALMNALIIFSTFLPFCFCMLKT